MADTPKPNITGRLEQDTIAHVACPRCGAPATHRCRDKHGKPNYKVTHMARTDAYKSFLGIDTYNQHYSALHKRIALGLIELPKAIKQTAN